ncbi:hypothetical protein ACFWOJ_30530 [Streptomyces sp. NPDC058439]|uniref:hypothetical protein n=1 Tax=Streptomyces sp. NPDC058439 TaxID=3346500 RepID=UPI003663B268
MTDDRRRVEGDREDVSAGLIDQAVVVCPAPLPAPDPEPEGDDQAPIVLEELTREQVLDLRTRAHEDHQ